MHELYQLLVPLNSGSYVVRVTTIVADYFVCQKFCGLATKRDTQIFRGGKFSLITSLKKIPLVISC